MKHVAAALCLVAAVSSRASAELKYTVHLELKQADAPADAPSNPMLAMIGAGMAKQLLPAGSADLVYTVGEKGARTDFLQAAMGNPAGTVTLARPDGTLLVLNPAEQTYWKANVQAAMSAMQSAGMAPEVAARRTGEFSTVAGIRCERVTFEWKMDLPIPDAARASLPPDFPSSIAMSGDGCSTTDRFQKYAAIARSTASGMMATLGLDKITQGGIVLRQNVRLFGMDLQSVVTEIAETDVSATLFDLPEGYKEVPPPAGMK